MGGLKQKRQPGRNGRRAAAILLNANFGLRTWSL
jgi:hypothetical protein